MVPNLDHSRWALGKAEERIKFLKNGPVVSQLEAVGRGHIVVMDGQTMSPITRTLYGAEQMNGQLKETGLN